MGGCAVGEVLPFTVPIKEKAAEAANSPPSAMLDVNVISNIELPAEGRDDPECESQCE